MISSNKKSFLTLHEVCERKEIPVYVQSEFNERELMTFYVENPGDLKVLKLSASVLPSYIGASSENLLMSLKVTTASLQLLQYL